MISPAAIIKMGEKKQLEGGEENIYEEIDIESCENERVANEEPNLLHGISAGRRKMIRNYALADWDFEQKFQHCANLVESKKVGFIHNEKGRPLVHS